MIPMGGLTWLRFNTLLVGSLTTTLLLALITAYLFSLKSKRTDTWYLAGYLAALLILLLSYTIRYSLFTSVSRHTRQFSNMIIFGVVCLIQFAYWYGTNHHRLESRIVFAVTLGAAVIVWGSLFFNRSSAVSYDFKAEYFSAAYGTRISYLILIGYLWSIVVLLRKVVRSSKLESGGAASPIRHLLHPAGRVARSARSFALLTLATTAIALTYMLFQTGTITSNTYALLFNNGSLLICLLTFIVYVNNSPQPTSFISKLTGIPLAVIMVAFGITASALMPVVHSGLADVYRQQIEQAQAAIRNRNLGEPLPGVAYILATDPTPAQVVYAQKPLSTREASKLARYSGREGLIPERSGLTPRFLYLDAADTGSFYLYYELEEGGRSYRVGLPYGDYRLWIHRFASKLVLVALGTYVLVVLGFPLVFRRGLVNPLVTLYDSVRQVSAGNYRMYVPVPSEDEIGQLARGYNQMVSYLRAAEGHFKALAENSADAILILSLEEKILYANRKCSEISGYGPAEFSDMHFRDLLHPDERAAAAGRFGERPAAGDAPQRYETRIVSKKGRECPVEITGARTTWQKNAAEVVIIRDVSARKEAEQQLHAQQQQLMRADKLASLGALVAGVAHEVNNPNQVIGMNARFLREGLPRLFTLAESGEQADETIRLSGMNYQEFKAAAISAFTEIDASTARIEHIVSELKRFVRGGAKQPRTPTDVNEVIRTIADLSRHMIVKTTDHFLLDLQGDLPRIFADRIGLEQVVLNLLQNACHALPDKDRRVRVSTRFDPKQRLLNIEVEDQGTGIPAEFLEKLTDPFFTTRAERGGTGLGLSVSRRIVREHGGSMRFRSTPGRGTNVTVSLPVAGDGD
jgi:PAS domain S-box-containing protein